MKNPTHIVIVGGGAGGLELATKLGDTLGKRKQAKITLVDANRTHIWKPRLHEVATGALNATVDELSYAAHGYHHHFEFIWGKMDGLDRDNKQISLAPLSTEIENILPPRTLNYDQLVIAVGSQTNDFGTPGASEHCIFLDRREAAEEFHQAFLTIYMKASASAQVTASSADILADKEPNTESNAQSNSISHTSTEQPEKEKFAIAIVGGGATGVELAAEIKAAAEHLSKYGFQGICPENVSITIIEAADRLMPALSPRASQAILRQLYAFEIDVLLGELVTQVSAEGLYTKSGKFIPAQLKVWSAGVKAPEFLTRLGGLETNRINQLVVKPTLQTTLDENIFAFGDCAQCAIKGSDRSVPPRAQAAHQQSSLLAKSLRDSIAGKPLREFNYQDKGSLVSLGKQGSVGNMMGNLSKDFTFEGKVARWLYVMLYRLHQSALHGWGKTLLLTIRDRINRKMNPSMKLH
ncbi:NAD(P)/FAD-dependent oxidoreductase [Pleionea sp. CnH1-48]|uniref:NAD(P)/FAD-dependent oxidoreductase n=1 Tax=Pleionea sp. CnH1-48 TaxID=2954494 RepID=UPI002096DF9B|nr:NAD(P)/FAD-dependent oxidoreductase [Pleionea sp. CnH1-48]MCO7223269.1 NAD(P)/FAD-dependent oxidoreductase [Pleionea sp. CnH1-48]